MNVVLNLGKSKIDPEWLKSIGISLDELNKAAEPAPLHKERASREQSIHEANSLLVSLQWPSLELMSVACWECKELFLTNYHANVYCSQRCYRDSLLARGLKWNPDRTLAEQWGNLEPPFMIPPEAIKAMRRLLAIVDQGKQDQSENLMQGIGREELIIEDEPLPDLPVPYTDPEIQSEPASDQQDSEFLSMLDAL